MHTVFVFVSGDQESAAAAYQHVALARTPSQLDDRHATERLLAWMDEPRAPQLRTVERLADAAPSAVHLPN